MSSKKAGIVIIGGGIVGVATAYFLAKMGGKNIVIIEREAILGNGSTGKCAGGIRQQFSSEINIKLQMASVKLFEDFDSETGGKANFRQVGYLFLASTPKEVEVLKRNVVMQLAQGLEVDELTPQEILDMVPWINIKGVSIGAFCQTDGIADPSGVVQGYWNKCQEMGVKVLLKT